MNDQDLDRIIDTAASEMIAREPSRALHHAVMARVRESDPPPRRFVWAITGVAAAACVVVIALVMMESRLPPMVQVQSPAPARLVVEPLAPIDRQGVPALGSAAPVARSTVRRAPGPAFAPNDLLSSIEPITADPIVLPSIDLPPLEYQAASVERLEIEALTIEPLTASND